MTSTASVIDAVHRLGSINKAAADLGISRFTAQKLFKKGNLEVSVLPDSDLDVDEIIAYRHKIFDRKMRAHQARQLVRIQLKETTAIGLCFFGDPHVDDDGTDLKKLFEDAKTCADTPGMYGMNQGDLQNNWVGRLQRLYAHQTTTVSQSWRIAEKFISMVEWLALVKGNHDLWAGGGDPLDWIMNGSVNIAAEHDVKISLDFKNKRSCRIWMRHDFQGHSMWNTLHGLVKSAQQGNDFHIFSAGHKHIAAHHTEYSPEMGHFWHALRVSGYKVLDGYAPELNLRPVCQMPAAVFIIDPNAKSELGFVRFEPDVQEGAEYLTWLRKRS